MGGSPREATCESRSGAFRMHGFRSPWLARPPSEDRSFNATWRPRGGVTLPRGKVYDVTPFMDDHPGGGEIMLSGAGKDATQDFEDVGHSPHARKLLEKYYLDEFAGGVGSGKMATKSGGGGGMGIMGLLLPILVVLMAFAAKYLTA